MKKNEPLCHTGQNPANSHRDKALDPMPERLQKLMARAGHGSRRKCEALIRAGRVHVNGRTARLGQKANPDSDVILVDGRQIAYEKTLYIKLNKPRGVISSR